MSRSHSGLDDVDKSLCRYQKSNFGRPALSYSDWSMKIEITICGKVKKSGFPKISLCSRVYPFLTHTSLEIRKRSFLNPCFCFFLRYLLQHHVASQDPLLHSEPHCAMRWHLLPLGASVLLAGRLGREDSTLHLNSSLPNHVLPAHIRDHPVNIASPAPTGKVPALHYDPSRFLRSYNHNGSQRPLPQT